MTGRADRVFADPIYGYVTVPFRILPLIDEPALQRLRRVSQTAMAEHVYPSLTGRRFAHSLGTMHLARLGFRATAQRTPARHLKAFLKLVSRDVSGMSDDELLDLLSDAVGAAGLLHDIGHTPFSHTLERVLEPALRRSLESLEDPTGGIHERAGRVIATRIMNRVMVADYPEMEPYTDNKLRWSEFAQLTLSILDSSLDGESTTWAEALHSLIASQIDVDRIDYLMRDSRLAGTEYGRINYTRILDSLEIRVDHEGRVLLGPGARARPAAERLLTEREQAYRWIYFHPRVVCQDHVLARSVALALELEASQAKLPSDAAAANGATALGTLFQHLRPNLDYIGASIETAPTVAAELDRRASLVDDSTVIEWLKSLYLATSDLDVPGEDERLGNFQRYVRSFLFREKALIPAWKSYEDYQGLSKAVATGMPEVFTLTREFALQTGLVNYLPWIDNLEAKWKEDASSALTHLLSDASDPVFDLEGFLNSSQDERFYWEVTRRDFAAATQAAFVFVEDQVRPLTETSPIVEALSRLHVLLPQTYILARVDGGSRKELSNLLATLLVSFFKQHLPKVLLNRATARGDAP